MSDTVSPVQSRRLSRTLRRWRERAEFSVERAAEELLCGAGTVSRMENGQSAEPLRVKAALELYGAPPRVVAEMIRAAKDRRRRGVLRRSYYDFVSHTFAEYLDLENEASAVACFQSDIVPGLLQTKEYARASIEGASALVEPGDRDKFIQLRMDRQQRLAGGDPMPLRVILVEAALCTQTGGPVVLAGQLRHLIKLAARPAIELRILPFTVGAHPAIGSNFTLLSFSGTDEPEVVYTENPMFFVIQDASTEVTRAQRIYDEVWEMALGAEASIDIVRQAITRLKT
ncbi:MAG: helix-turn-helix transcriptional regulator [Kibdelosporangium sp.]